MIFLFVTQRNEGIDENCKNIQQQHHPSLRPMVNPSPHFNLLAKTSLILLVVQGRNQGNTNQGEWSSSQQQTSLGNQLRSRNRHSVFHEHSLDQPGQSKTHTNIQNLRTNRVRDSHRSITLARDNVTLHGISDGSSQGDKHHTHQCTNSSRVEWRNEWWMCVEWYW